MLEPKNARGESWTPMDGKKKFTPLFSSEEIEKANEITRLMDGMDLESSFELLEKIKKYFLQAAQIHAESYNKVLEVADETGESLRGPERHCIQDG